MWNMASGSTLHFLEAERETGLVPGRFRISLSFPRFHDWLGFLVFLWG